MFYCRLEFSSHLFFVFICVQLFEECNLLANKEWKFPLSLSSVSRRPYFVLRSSSFWRSLRFFPALPCWICPMWPVTYLLHRSFHQYSCFTLDKCNVLRTYHRSTITNNTMVWYHVYRERAGEKCRMPNRGETRTQIKTRNKDRGRRGKTLHRVIRERDR